MDEALGTCNIIELRHRSLKTLSLPLLPAPPPQRHPAFEACSWLLAEKMAGRQAAEGRAASPPRGGLRSSGH